VAHQPTAVVAVRVPESFAADASLSLCFRFRPNVPAGCAHGLSGRSTEVRARTYVGRYPPLYFLLVGAPSLLWSTNTAVYGMRLLSVAWSALLLGLAVAVAAVLSRSRLLVAAVALAATPMTVFLASTVNPNGLEISAAIATWTTGVVLVLEHRRRPPSALVAACAASASVLVLCRGLSPLWLAVIAVTLVALVPRAVGELGRHRQVQIGLAVVAAVGVVAVVFILAAHTLAVLPAGAPVGHYRSSVGVFTASLGYITHTYNQAVGTFGWLDTPSPTFVVLCWAAAAALVVVLGALTASRRLSLVLAGLLVVSVLLPTAVVASQARHLGVTWQARYGMPLYAGGPLVGAAIMGRNADGTPRRRGSGFALPGVLVIVVAAAQLVDFVWALRRYTVGMGSTWFLLARVRGGWAPPVPALLLLVAALGVTLAYGWWLRMLTRPPGRRGRPGPHGRAEPAGIPVADEMADPTRPRSPARPEAPRTPARPEAPRTPAQPEAPRTPAQPEAPRTPVTVV